MKSTLLKLGASLAIGIVGLTMTFYGLERSALIEAQSSLSGVDMPVPTRIFITLFFGLTALNVSVFSALTIWSSYLRKHEGTKQLPIWSLIAALVVAGGLGITGLAQHGGYINTLAEVPMDANQGYIAYMTVCGTFFVAALVLVGVRWRPGHARAMREQ